MTLFARKPGGLLSAHAHNRGGQRLEGESRTPMMHGEEKSLCCSSREVAEQSRETGCGGDGAESGRQGECGTAKHAPDTEPETVLQSLGRIRQAAIRDKRTVFTALLHHVTPELLEWAFFQLKKSAAPGVDGVTWDQYEAGPAGQTGGPARTGPAGRIPGTSVPAPVYPQTGWAPAPTRHSRAGRQDRPTRGGGRAERHLRDGLRRVLLWVPPRTQPARCAGCPGGGSPQAKGGLGAGRRPRGLLGCCFIVPPGL